MAEATPVCNFGWKAPSFTLPGVDGKTYSLEGLRGPKGTLVMFICNHCPYVKAVIDRIVRDANDDYNDRVIVVDPQTNRIVWQYGHTADVYMMTWAMRHSIRGQERSGRPAPRHPAMPPPARTQTRRPLHPTIGPSTLRSVSYARHAAAPAPPGSSHP